MDVANNDVEDEEMLEDAPPVIVNYAKYDNRITVFQGWSVLMPIMCWFLLYFEGKREFDLLVKFIETKEFDPYEYPEEDEEEEFFDEEGDKINNEKDKEIESEKIRDELWFKIFYLF